MKGKQLIRVSTQKTIVPQKPSPGLEVQYPYTWFDANRGAKPTLTLSLVCKDIKTAADCMVYGIKNNAMDLDVAKTFLYFFASQVKDKLTEEWKSYQIVIGATDAEMTPLSLVNCKTASVTREINSMTSTPADYPWIAGIILGIYRLCRASLPQYRSILANKITVQLKALCSTTEDMSDMTDQYSGWLGDKGYTCLIAAYDMFFNKFPGNKYANLRIGTTGSSFRDCAGIISYGYLVDLLGMPDLTDVMDWVFLEQIGTDIDRMMDTKDELNAQHSGFIALLIGCIQYLLCRIFKIE